MKPESREFSLPDRDAERLMARKTRRGFVVAGIAAAAGIGGFAWLNSGDDNGAPWLQRRVLDFNGGLSQAYLSNAHLMPQFRIGDVRPLKPNGNFGLTDDIEDWDLTVDTGVPAPLTLALEDIRALPKTEFVTRFCCIEGWSTVVHWGGARFSEFTMRYYPPRRPWPDFVYLSTPDEEYYVGLDMKSALHPQTLLAYEMNGVPLTKEHGAPLRLVIPVKYGIKNIKRIGTIQYTNKKPGDYWAEEGYDWFAGL